MSTSVVQFSILEENATIEPLLDIREHIQPHLSNKSSPSSFYQLTNAILIIVDNGLNCIHSVNTVDLIIKTISGICNKDESLVTEHGIDGSFNQATYNSPTRITSYEYDAPSLLLLDLGSVRKLDFLSNTTSTVYQGDLKSSYNDLSVFSDSIALSCSDQLIILHRNFSKEQSITFSYRKKMKSPLMLMASIDSLVSSLFCRNLNTNWYSFGNNYLSPKWQNPYLANNGRGFYQGSTTLCPVWRDYEFHQVVWITPRHLIAILSKTDEHPSTLAFINFADGSKMKILCSKKFFKKQSFCGDMTVKEYSFIAKINRTLIVIPKTSHSSVKHISAYTTVIHGKYITHRISEYHLLSIYVHGKVSNYVNYIVQSHFYHHLGKLFAAVWWKTLPLSWVYFHSFCVVPVCTWCSLGHN